MNGVVNEKENLFSQLNYHLHAEDDDVLYHFGLSKRRDDLQKLFAGVKVSEPVRTRGGHLEV